MKPKKFDFGGFATRHNVQCADGRIIQPDAFKNIDGQKVPLVYHHIHDDIANVLGHALMENRPEGVYAYCNFNDSPNAQMAKSAVLHGDITALSIYANRLKQNGLNVIHGSIKEVSLVLSGANPGATIDNIAFQHGDDYSQSEEDALIHSGLEIDIPKTEKEEPIKEETMATNEDTNETVQDVIDTMSEKQQTVMYAMVGAAIEETEAKYADDLDADMDEDLDEETLAQSDIRGGYMKKNVFENQNDQDNIAHSDMVAAVFADLPRVGSFKDTLLQHGITNIDTLFPEAHNVTSTPEMITRQMEWVPKLLGGVRKSPFPRIKSVAFNVTEDEARAKGYIKGREKADQVILALKRETNPQTIYKKQSFDRDDILDITEFDVIAFTQSEMRVMIEEELGRAILIGDGRNVSATDKINPLNIRPVYGDDAVYNTNLSVTAATGTSLTDNVEEIIDSVILNRSKYRGSGSPTAYVTPSFLAAARTLRDSHGYRRYNSDQDLANDLRAKEVVEVEVMEGATRVADGKTYSLQILIFNPMDYSIGSAKGGELTTFDDFDIDFNKMKYLIETRLSGALTKPFSALTVETVPGA